MPHYRGRGHVVLTSDNSIRRNSDGYALAEPICDEVETAGPKTRGVAVVVGPLQVLSISRVEAISEVVQQFDLVIKPGVGAFLDPDHVSWDNLLQTGPGVDEVVEWTR